MISPLSVVSDGYLSTTKRVLVIAVAGYLNFGGGEEIVSRQQGGIAYEEVVYTGGDGGQEDLFNDDEAVIISLQAFIICRQ